MTLELTKREIEVLDLIAQGSSYDEVAGKLHITRVTVKNHLQACRFKLNAKRTAEACCIALRRGLIK